jgi:hypothetical protein
MVFFDAIQWQLVSPTPTSTPPVPTQTIRVSVNKGSDDAGTNPDPCVSVIGDNEVYLGDCFNSADGDITSGFRFENVQIPRGAKIESAYIHFTVDGTYTVPVRVSIYGEASGNPLTYSVSNPPAIRNKTSWAIVWDIPETDTWSLGESRSTPNFYRSIQEIIDRDDWDIGHPVSVIITDLSYSGVRRVIAYERAVLDPQLEPAELEITYSYDGTPPPTVMPPTDTPTPVPPTDTPTPIPPTPEPLPKCSDCSWIRILQELFGGCTESSASTNGLSTIQSDSYTSSEESPFDIDVFYSIRDNVLSQTPQGQHYIDLYETFTPEIADAIGEHPQLLDEAIDVIQRWEPKLQALVEGNGNSVVITSEDVLSVQSFLNNLKAFSSSELQNAINNELSNHPLQNMIGMTMDQSWMYLNGFPSTAVLDDFNRADGSIGSNWSGDPSSYVISSNQLHFYDNAINDLYWNPSSFGADQEVYVTFAHVDTQAGEQDLLLKAQSNSNWGAGVLEVMYDAPNHRVQVWTWEWPAGWIQRGADIPVTFVDGDQFGARALADGTVEVYRNEELLAQRDASAWSHYDEGGYIGLWLLSADNAVLDDFGGGTVPGGMQSMMAMAPSSAEIDASQLDAVLNNANIFWQGVPIGSGQKANVTLTSLQTNPQGIFLKPQSNGVWGDDTVEVLYDVAGGRIQVWMYDVQVGKGWIQYGKDIPVKFSAGDQFSVQVLVDGTVQIYRNGKLLAKRDVIP